MPASIEAAEQRINELELDIKKYEKKMSACDAIRPAYESNQNTLQNLEGVENAAATVINHVGAASKAGYDAFSQGSCNFEQENGTSRDFKVLESNNESLQETSTEMIQTKNELYERVSTALKQLDNNKERFSQRIISDKSEIERLRAWIDEEIHRQQEKPQSTS